MDKGSDAAGKRVESKLEIRISKLQRGTVERVTPSLKERRFEIAVLEVGGFKPPFLEAFGGSERDHKQRHSVWVIGSVR
jgi:hypothetical protein